MRAQIGLSTINNGYLASFAVFVSLNPAASIEVLVTRWMTLTAVTPFSLAVSRTEFRDSRIKKKRSFSDRSDDDLPVSSLEKISPESTANINGPHWSEEPDAPSWQWKTGRTPQLITTASSSEQPTDFFSTDLQAPHIHESEWPSFTYGLNEFNNDRTEGWEFEAGFQEFISVPSPETRLHFEQLSDLPKADVQTPRVRVQKDTRSRLHCEQCPLTFARPQEFRRHMRTKHSSRDVQTYRCQVPGCDYYQSRLDKVREHVRIMHGLYSGAIVTGSGSKGDNIGDPAKSSENHDIEENGPILEGTLPLSPDRSRSVHLENQDASDIWFKLGFLGRDGSLDTPKDLEQHIIATFGKELIKKSGSLHWITYARAHTSQEEIESLLGRLLKEYTGRSPALIPRWTSNIKEAQLESIPRQELPFAMCNNVIDRNVPYIIRYFWENTGSSQDFGQSTNARPQESEPLREKGGSIDQPIHKIGGVVNTDIGLGRILDRILSAHAFHVLTSGLRDTLYLGLSSRMLDIRHHMEARLRSSKVNKVCFNINWALKKFMRAQYGEAIPQIGSVVVITGSALYAQATTCAKYMEQTWNDGGKFLLNTLDLLLGNVKVPASRSCQDTSYISSSGLKFSKLCITDKYLKMTAEAPTDELLATLAQQLAWLGSALTTSPFGNKLSYCKSIGFEQIINLSDASIEYEHEPLHATEAVCWLPLFSGAVIASGFPVPVRTGEIGLEIPLDLLAAIVGVQNVVEYEGSIVMKGFSCMLVPASRNNRHIQWHAIFSQQPSERLTYQEGISRIHHRALLHEVNLENFRDYKAIVGWCSVAKSRLGATSVNYENIDYSGADEISTSITCSGGSLGFQQFGTASLNFSLGPKDGKCHFQRRGPYRDIVSVAERTRIVLYDTGEKRSWLVPASNVMLHMIQHRHYLEPFELSGQGDVLDIDTGLSFSAKEVMLKNESLDLLRGEKYTFKDAVLGIWSLLEFLIDHNVSREKDNAGAPLKSPFQEILHGFEFKAIVEQRSPFRLKQTRLRKTNGGWPLLANDIDALVLLADGFEDLIIPAESRNPGLCHSWSKLPKGQDYLAASTMIMKDIYDVAGSRLNRKYLTTTHLQWHQGSSLLFDHCLKSDISHCECNRLQSIHRESTIGSIASPTFIAEQGAVIFGQSKQSGQSVLLKPRNNVVTSRGIYSQENVSILPIDSRKESGERFLSDSDTPNLGESDGTIGSDSTGSIEFASYSTQKIALSLEKHPISHV